MRALIEGKGWKFLRLRIVSLSHRSGNKWWSRALLARICRLKNLAISISRLSISESILARINGMS